MGTISKPLQRFVGSLGFCLGRAQSLKGVLYCMYRYRLRAAVGWGSTCTATGVAACTGCLQAGVMAVGQPFPLWARQAKVMLKVTSMSHAAAAAAAAAAGTAKTGKAGVQMSQGCCQADSRD